MDKSLIDMVTLLTEDTMTVHYDINDEIVISDFKSNSNPIIISTIIKMIYDIIVKEYTLNISNESIQAIPLNFHSDYEKIRITVKIILDKNDDYNTVKGYTERVKNEIGSIISFFKHYYNPSGS